MTANTMEEAIDIFLESLSDEDKKIIAGSLPIFNIEQSRVYIDRLISLFQLERPETNLSKDIDARFSDCRMFSSEILLKNNALYYGQTILQEASKVLDGLRPSTTPDAAAVVTELDA